MDREERRSLRQATADLSDLVDMAERVVTGREGLVATARSAKQDLASRPVALSLPDGLAARALALNPERDVAKLSALADAARLEPISALDHQVLTQLRDSVAPALPAARKATGPGRLLMASTSRAEVAANMQYLLQFATWAKEQEASTRLVRLADKPAGLPRTELSLGTALRDNPLEELVPDLGGSSTVLGRSELAELRKAVRGVQDLLRAESTSRAAAVRAGEAVRRMETARFVRDIPVDRLREATAARIRTGPLTDAGVRTVGDVLDRGGSLESIPGIGPTTAVHIEGAARTIWQATFDEMPVRIDIKNRHREVTELLLAVRSFEATRQAMRSARLTELARAFAGLATRIPPDTTHVVVTHVQDRASEVRALIEEFMAAAALVTGAAQGRQTTEIWEDFLARPADYYAALSELGITTEDEAKSEGDLPAEIVDAVRALTLDGTYLSASLRGYQSFGARFALVQKKVIIGDEMGLGKTIEALAVLAHLRAKGSQHFLVTCPAAVVTNWMREIGSKTKLPAHRLHGQARTTALAQWIRRGGVAVTTFDTLRWLDTQAPFRGVEVSCVVVDEAHYIKNPLAQRSTRAAAAMDQAEHAILLTGTPMENRLEEFQTLVEYLRPDLVVEANEFAPKAFRRQVAPAYIRRNQEDVLTELPELVEVDEWLPMSSGDSRAYVDAVSAGNFMAMRQAGMLAPSSAKVDRLKELVGEAEESGRRVIVFSYFRDVLARLTEELPGIIFGPLTGSVSAMRRQQIVDDFSRAQGGAVLVSQIEAGGVGLNIQAASMVVICEPQLKPTTEWQAIARARRMGQLETVQVHRLLSEDGVDRRITEILARKAGMFEEFARVSETAGSAPEALDITEAELAKQIVAEERVRLLS